MTNVRHILYNIIEISSSKHALISESAIKIYNSIKHNNNKWLHRWTKYFTIFVKHESFPIRTTWNIFYIFIN